MKSSYAMFAAAYVLLFAFAFASINNFGILARQRVQMFPLMLVLLALPPRPPRAAKGQSERTEFEFARV